MKLSELVNARAKMTKSPWRIDDEHRMNVRVCDGKCGEPDSGGSHHHCGTVIYSGDIVERDACGIVATHNAADVLIQIAQAALAVKIGSPNPDWPKDLERLRLALLKIEP